MISRYYNEIFLAFKSSNILRTPCILIFIMHILRKSSITQIEVFIFQCMYVHIYVYIRCTNKYVIRKKENMYFFSCSFSSFKLIQRKATCLASILGAKSFVAFFYCSIWSLFCCNMCQTSPINFGGNSILQVGAKTETEVLRGTIGVQLIKWHIGRTNRQIDKVTWRGRFAPIMHAFWFIYQ